MKTYQCKKSVLAIGLAVGMVSTGALAAVGSTSTQDFLVTASVESVVDVENALKLDFGPIDPSGTDTITPTNSMSFCIYSSTGSATVKVTSAGGESNFTDSVGALTHPSVSSPGSFDTILYTLNYGPSATPFTWGHTGSAVLTSAEGVIDQPCSGSGGAVSISGQILSTDYANKPAGDYTDTVTIDVSPA